MKYNRLIAVTGQSGLFELVSSKNDGAIVKSLEDKTTKFVSSRIHQFSHLESIEVYTLADNINLADVFLAIEASTEALPGSKDVNAIKEYFGKLNLDLDFERIYNSDLKKMIKWYEILKKADVKIEKPVYGEEVAEEAAPEA
ncbi:DUF5606 family protein [Polluticaenibacter yanchengensis]|uniref:DUF5606 domain-containing protein n=1 Tax=Polluticaenibacter yanchengensis TaxID=3014562 RepID=A0ABT4UH48_9BACT|nr:DUF5606 domain-containing protein [Chitinophagaceae bacterium LY-5]